MNFGTIKGKFWWLCFFQTMTQKFVCFKRQSNCIYQNRSNNIIFPYRKFSTKHSIFHKGPTTNSWKYRVLHSTKKFTQSHPNKMFRFPSPSLSWRWVGRLGKKKKTLEGFRVPAKAWLLSTKAWLRGPFVRNQMV